MLCTSAQAIHRNTTKASQRVDSHHFPSLGTRIIPHKRRHHSHDSHTRSVRHDRIPLGSSVFSARLFHELHAQLGISMNNSGVLLASEEEKVILQRSPRLRTTESPPVNEVLADGYPWNSQSVVPHRYRYKYSSYYYPPKTSQPEDPSVAAGISIDPCVLARWNYEVGKC